MTGGYTLANSVADARVLQCYESESMTAFGHELTVDQWRAICGVKEVYDGLLFTTHAAAVNLAYPLVSRIREELSNDDRKFMFLCGHDSNLASISAALRLNLPEIEQTLELPRPLARNSCLRSGTTARRIMSPSTWSISPLSSCRVARCYRLTCHRWCFPLPSRV